jgi:hypothetical protein
MSQVTRTARAHLLGVTKTVRRSSSRPVQRIAAGQCLADNLVPNEASKKGQLPTSKRLILGACASKRQAERGSLPTRSWAIAYYNVYYKRLMCGHFSLLMNPGGR